MELLIPVHATEHSSLDFSADLTLCKSTCASSSIKYIMRNPHITSISAKGTLEKKNIHVVIFVRVLSYIFLGRKILGFKKIFSFASHFILSRNLFVPFRLFDLEKDFL